MSDIQHNLSERKSEANEMFEIISYIQNSDIDNSITKVAMLRSAFVLLLYNMIESTAFLVFERIHERVALEHYGALGSEMRKIWVDYFFSNHKASDHHTHMEGTLTQTIKLPLLEDFSKKVKLFSGNLDGLKINSLLKKYGVQLLTDPGREKLVVVKNRRNSLAHGEDMFKEACRDLSDSDLAELRDSTFSALDNLIGNVESFLSGKVYLAVAN
ncbi:MAE_28990/MAE_18760 family HEPN-like nuclease [Pseudomonas veronii]|jgi:hypothetical protein|uniref:MAE_28990/MAE_18760 family HEPN-like nuclease n=1 Tax=Pseudomonas veronii TaxID=76761 RepID=UPI00143D23BD|nr:MAE_28990/MAE_18760 family HEPN-like nuclease [Pseudomonas veronii]